MSRPKTFCWEATCKNKGKSALPPGYLREKQEGWEGEKGSSSEGMRGRGLPFQQTGAQISGGLWVGTPSLWAHTLECPKAVVRYPCPPQQPHPSSQLAVAKKTKLRHLTGKDLRSPDYTALAVKQGAHGGNLHGDHVHPRHTAALSNGTGPNGGKNQEDSSHTSSSVWIRRKPNTSLPCNSNPGSFRPRSNMPLVFMPPPTGEYPHTARNSLTHKYREVWPEWRSTRPLIQ